MKKSNLSSHKVSRLSVFSTEERGGFAKNLSYAIIAQGISLLSSCLISLVLPKFLGLEDYAYWQLFLFYPSYSGLTLLGLHDGLYLRHGGKRYDELDQGELKAQQIVVLISQIFAALCCWGAIALSDMSPYRSLVLSLSVVLGLLYNITYCLRYVFTSTNLTRISSFADMMNGGLFILCMITMLFVGTDSSLPYIIGYLICQAAVTLYVFICARKTFSAKADFMGIIRTCFKDVQAGLMITVSWYADRLIVGFSRMITDWHLGITVFSKLSVSFSLTNLVLQFIGQSAMVAFPMLKRLDPDGQKGKYLYIRLLLHTILPCAYLLYIPVKKILGLWLPEYSKSFMYLALTMPLCVYSSKANMLFNTFLKIERRESTLCIVNVATMVFNSILAFIGIFGSGSVEIAVCVIIFSMIARDFLFEKLMADRFGNPILGHCISEALITIGFMAASWFLDAWSIPIVAAMLAVYLLIDRDGVSLVINETKRKIAGRK